MLQTRWDYLAHYLTQATRPVSSVPWVRMLNPVPHKAAKV